MRSLTRRDMLKASLLAPAVAAASSAAAQEPLRFSGPVSSGHRIYPNLHCIKRKQSAAVLGQQSVTRVTRPSPDL